MMRIAPLIYREVLIQWSLRPVAWTQLLYPLMYIFVAGSAYGALIRTVNVQGREIPFDRAPEIIRVLGTLNPLSSYAGLLRSALLGIPLESSSLHLLWSLVFTLVSFAVAVVAFGRIEP